MKFCPECGKEITCKSEKKDELGETVQRVHECDGCNTKYDYYYDKVLLRTEIKSR
jgi:DNA-directed RNA polymerase subunit M/transcription elongation factor TFIIS